jgi:hypothetical protein
MQRLIIAFCFFLVSCSELKEKIEFAGYPKPLLYTGEVKNNIEQSLFEFYEYSGKRVSTGNYLDGFKNNQWYYNIQDSLIEIKWAHFKDKKLGFETNIFDFADTVYYSDYYTQIDYKFGNGIITLGVSINNPQKDSLEVLGYKKISSDEMGRMGYSIIFFDSTTLGELKIFTLSANNLQGKEINMNTAFGYIGTEHLQVSLISTGSVKKEYRDIFFDGVLTNFFYKSQRLYFPFLLVKD